MHSKIYCIAWDIGNHVFDFELLNKHLKLFAHFNIHQTDKKITNDFY